MAFPLSWLGDCSSLPYEGPLREPGGHRPIRTTLLRAMLLRLPDLPAGFAPPLLAPQVAGGLGEGQGYVMPGFDKAWEAQFTLSEAFRTAVVQSNASYDSASDAHASMIDNYRQAAKNPKKAVRGSPGRSMSWGSARSIARRSDNAGVADRAAHRTVRDALGERDHGSVLCQLAAYPATVARAAPTRETRAYRRLHTDHVGHRSLGCG
jgi:hypothetical protein